MTEPYHTPALVETVVKLLLTKPDGVYVDGTLGGGGHARAMLDVLSPGGKVIGIDQDADAVEHAQKELKVYGRRFAAVHERFSAIKDVLRRQSVDRIDGLLLDLGVSSYQINEGARGFSFQQAARIDMRMDRRRKIDGRMVINSYDEARLAKIFREYGEERHAGRLARAIQRRREKQHIETTKDLADIVRSVLGGQYVQKSLARIFQAIRIEVNDEMGQLEAGLHEGTDVLAVGGRLAVISYHSLEDRLVKNFFRAESQTSIRSGHALVPDLPSSPRLAVLTKKPVEPDDEEQAMNPRVRSAKLRAAERVGG